MMSNIEKQMEELRQTQVILSPQTQRISRQDDTEPLIPDDSSTVSSNDRSPRTPPPRASPPSSSQLVAVRHHHHHTLAKTHSDHDKTGTGAWRLSVTKSGRLCIETNIRSYEDLMHQLYAIMHSEGVPFCKQPASMDPTLIHRYKLNAGMRRAHYKAVMECIADSTRQYKSSSPPAMQIGYYCNPADAHKQPDHAMTSRLLDAYFSCQFYRSVIVHRRTFYTRFVNGVEDFRSSSVLCAKCAAIITMRCRHVLSIVSREQQVPLHTYYASMARRLVAATFDEPTLDTFATYVFLAQYHVNVLQPEEAEKYLDFAARIGYLLRESLQDHTDEYELFKRLNWLLLNTSRFIQFAQNRRGVPVRSMEKKRQQHRPARFFEEAKFTQEYAPKPLPDEPPKVVRSLFKDVYGQRLHSILSPYLRETRFSKSQTLSLPLLLQTESALKEYYYKDIPPEYRLSLNISDAGLTDEEFRRRLRNDPNCDSASVNLAIRYFQAMIGIHEPLIPPLPTKLSGTSHNNNERRLLSLLNDEDEEEQDDRGEEEECSMHTVRAFETSYRASVILVRLFEYYIFDLDMCSELVVPCLLSAWDIHLRNACLGLTDPEELNDHVPSRVIKVAREYVLRCINIFRRGYHYNAADHAMWKHYQDVENKVLEAMFVAIPYTEPCHTSNVW